jgi:hypothetical protein
MADEDVAWYQRLLDAQPDLIDFPWCWTVVQPVTKPVTVVEAVRRFGGDPADIEEHAGWDFKAPERTLHLHQVGPVVVVAEVGGWEGSRDEALRWLSDGALVHTSWWSEANGRSFLCYAAFGLVLTRLESLDDDDPVGKQPTALDEDRAAFGDDGGYAAQLAFVERRTGIRVDPAWLDQPHATVVVRTPIPDDPRPPGRFGLEDPDLAALFLLADEFTQRAALRWVLDMLAHEQGLRGEPAAGTVLDALSQGWPTGGDLSRQLEALRGRLWQEVNASRGGSPERWRHFYRVRAVEAFAATVIGSSDASYPTDALWCAQQAFQDRWPTVRAELWRRARGRHR